jgi:hypothetical protein
MEKKKKIPHLISDSQSLPKSRKSIQNQYNNRMKISDINLSLKVKGPCHPNYPITQKNCRHTIPVSQKPINKLISNNTLTQPIITFKNTNY